MIRDISWEISALKKKVSLLIWILRHALDRLNRPWKFLEGQEVWLP